MREIAGSIVILSGGIVIAGYSSSGTMEPHPIGLILLVLGFIAMFTGGSRSQDTADQERENSQNE